MQVLRDIIVGPLTEEFAFRSCMAPLLLLQVSFSFSFSFSLL